MNISTILRAMINEIDRIYSNTNTFLSINLKNILRTAWTLGCVVATFYATTWQFRRYYTIEDQTIIEYKRFHEREKDVYPSISLCWNVAINEEKLKRYGENFTSMAYVDFLFGNLVSKKDLWNKDMLAVDYDNVTTRFEDYLIEYGYEYGFQNIPFRGLHNKEMGIKTISGLKELSFFSQKCLTIDIPFNKSHSLNTMYVNLKPTIFGNELGLANPYSPHNKFALVLHYPNQLLGQLNLGKLNWYLRGPSSISGYLLRIGQMDVHDRGNTKQNPCIEGIPDYDQMAIKAGIKRIGCKPPYWNSISSFAPCSKKDQLRRFGIKFLNVSKSGNKKTSFMSKSPCRRMERINYDLQTFQKNSYSDVHFSGNETTVSVLLDFTEFTYKEVRNVRGMDDQTLIGNIHLSTTRYD